MPASRRRYNKLAMKIMDRVGIIAFIALVASLSIPNFAILPATNHNMNHKLENCLRVADYVGKSKVFSCQKTAEVSATVSMSFANSFTNCIEQLDRMIPANRDACHKQFQKR